jgi:hypothetical protein
MATKKKKTTKPSTKPKKKAPAKKIKVATKKSVATKKKAVPNPHEGKRYFMLDFGGYGGELMVDNVPEEFVEYWLDEERKHGLSEHIMAMHEKAAYGDDFDEDMEDEDDESDEDESGFDRNSPEVVPGRKYVEYWELDGIEHDTVVSAEYSSFTVTEVELSPKAVYVNGGVEWDDKETKKRNFDYSQKIYTEKGDSKDYSTDGRKHVYSTEMFVHDTKKGLVDPVPVLMCYDAQKGSFGRVVVETNGEDFDINKLVFGICENTMTTHIDQYFYDKKPLSVDMDYLSTWGKGFHTSVGYMPKGDTEWNYEELLKYGWEDLEESE